MGVNNDGRGFLTVSNSSYFPTGTVYKRSVKGVEEKHEANRQTKSRFNTTTANQQRTSGEFFRNESAKEIHQTITDGFQELSLLTQQRAHPYAYLYSSKESQSEYNQRDFKRHQNYFNQIMNYENPAGSWVDVKA